MNTSYLGFIVLRQFTVIFNMAAILDFRKLVEYGELRHFEFI